MYIEDLLAMARTFGVGDTLQAGALDFPQEYEAEFDGTVALDLAQHLPMPSILLFLTTAHSVAFTATNARRVLTASGFDDVSWSRWSPSPSRARYVA